MRPLRGTNDNLVRVRRRQSDARWRANLSSCYETLKHIIPVTKRATKKQISKAIILKETDKHIDFLESMVVTLLEEKAERQGIKNVSRWCTRKVNQLQESFIVAQKQQSISNKKAPKGRKNLGLCIPEVPKSICTGLDKEVDDGVEVVDAGYWRRLKAPVNSEMLEITPVKNEEDYEHGIGFTPVKLPPSRCWAHTPTKNLENLEALGEYSSDVAQAVKSGFLNEEDGGDDSGMQRLFCTERMWLTDDEDVSATRNQMTPSSHKPSKLCCKYGPKKARSKIEDGIASSNFAYSLNQQENVKSKCNRSHRRQNIKCCRALNLNGTEVMNAQDNIKESLASLVAETDSIANNVGWPAERVPHQRIVICKQEIPQYGNILKPLFSLASAASSEQTYQEFEAEFCLLDSVGQTSEDIKNSVFWRDGSPLLSQTSSVFTDSVDDRFHSLHQAGLSKVAMMNGDFESEGSQGHIDLVHNIELDYDMKPLLPKMVICDSQISSDTDAQPEYLGQYSPLFGHGIACLLNI